MTDQLIYSVSKESFFRLDYLNFNYQGILKKVNKSATLTYSVEIQNKKIYGLSGENVQNGHFFFFFFF